MKLQVDVNVDSLEEAAGALEEIAAAVQQGSVSGSYGDGGRFELLVPVEPLAH
jgi:hypothetical protein